MIAKPTNRDQARSNAILAAERAEGARSAVDSVSHANLAQAWAAIAETFPQDETTMESRLVDSLPETAPTGFMRLSDEERETIEALRSGKATVHLNSLRDKDQRYSSDLVKKLLGAASGGTLGKVYVGLFDSGLSEQQAIDAINNMMNQGIVFREVEGNRTKSYPVTLDEARTYENGDWIKTEAPNGEVFTWQVNEHGGMALHGERGALMSGGNPRNFIVQASDDKEHAARVAHALIVGLLRWAYTGKLAIKAEDVDRCSKRPLSFSVKDGNWTIRLADDGDTVDQ